jgi:hypothetical protein
LWRMNVRESYVLVGSGSAVTIGARAAATVLPDLFEARIGWWNHWRRCRGCNRRGGRTDSDLLIAGAVNCVDAAPLVGVVKVTDGVVKLTVCAVLVTEAERIRLASRLAVLRRVVKIVIAIDGCGRNKTDAHTGERREHH